VKIAHPKCAFAKPKQICKSASIGITRATTDPALHMVLLQYSQRNAPQRSTCIDDHARQQQKRSWNQVPQAMSTSAAPQHA
jgi:hypothetical protein